MQYIADLHTHSMFSRATSKASNLAGLFVWARIKGIQLVGTGDFTHPGWLGQLKENLLPAEPGFFRLRDEDIPPPPGIAPAPATVRFVLTSEISSIYKRDGRVRKIHNLLFVPDFESVTRINARLAAIGNIESDGRPILGLDSRDLLEILLEQAPDGFLVPAHIWTPWFSLFGSKSGFDVLEECFADLSQHIFALETGLSSDPDMNRMVSALDRFTLISNSDCHSPAKLGREANCFTTDFDFYAMRRSLKDGSSGGFQGTLEFFPEEGKYHLDGHRKCRVCLDPQQTRALETVCPACGRPLTVGVLHRVLELADRKTPFYPEGSAPFHSMIPLPEVLSEIMRVGPASKRVTAQYGRLISSFGSEFEILLNTPCEEIGRVSPVLAEAIGRIRRGQVIRDPGYDGEFGKIRVFSGGELDTVQGQQSLFNNAKPHKVRKNKARNLDIVKSKTVATDSETPPAQGLNPEQRAAVESQAEHILVHAGPGTGKTLTLVERMTRLLAGGCAQPEQFTAITFTNRAAEEVRERLKKKLGGDCEKVFVGTFHLFCLQWLKRESPGLTVVGDEARKVILKRILAGAPKAEIKAAEEIIFKFFHDRNLADQDNKTVSTPVKLYLDELDRQQGIDIASIIPFFVRQLQAESALRAKVLNSITHLFIDEFQDLNRAQYDLIAILAERAKVFAIGDPNQAIYGFRGSSPRFFRTFGRLASTKTYILRRNYRSAPVILEAAAAVIKNNSGAGDAGLSPQLDVRGRIEHYRAPTPAAEAEFIVRRIEEFIGGISHFSIESGRGGDLKENAGGFADIAVLYRLSQQSAELNNALERRGIPCQLVGGKPFFMARELKVLYYWLIIAAGMGGTAEHIALCKGVRGIGSAVIRRLEEIPLNRPDFFTEAAALNLTNDTLLTIDGIRSALARFRKKCATDDLAAAVMETMARFAIDPMQPIAGRFLELAGAFGRDLTSFARHLEQNRAAAVYDQRAEAVSLMTMHAAKGLEFPVVFITGLEEGLLPCSIGDMETDIEEERRLFYVALTRARRTLILTSAARRTIYGQNREQIISRFCAEIPAHLIKTASCDRRQRKKQGASQLSLF